MKIMYENETCIFDLDREQTLDLLRNYAHRHNVNNAKEILSLIERCPDEICLISEEHQYIEYVILELIEEGSALAKCKACEKKYRSQELVPFELGHGKSPFSRKKRLKDIFSKNLDILKGFGGKGYKCPRGHILISRVTWIV